MVDSNEILIDNIPVTVFSGVFDAVLQDFADRFQDFEKIAQTLRLVAFSHLVDTESAPLHFQMDLVELKNYEKLVAKFNQNENLIETWKSDTEYPLLRELAREILVLFGSTYVCVLAFSMMKYLKNEYRTRLLDGNLESQIKLMVSREVPDFARLAACMQDRGSHEL